jgi:hypothetical protein
MGRKDRSNEVRITAVKKNYNFVDRESLSEKATLSKKKIKVFIFPCLTVPVKRALSENGVAKSWIC